jgi:hypothetical protein
MGNRTATRQHTARLRRSAGRPTQSGSEVHLQESVRFDCATPRRKTLVGRRKRASSGPGRGTGTIRIPIPDLQGTCVVHGTADGARLSDCQVEPGGEAQVVLDLELMESVALEGQLRGAARETSVWHFRLCRPTQTPGRRCGPCCVHCARRGRDELVAFSCKGRSFCPSCCGRRTADTAMHLADEVLPEAPIRQWVLSFPYRVRYLLAYDAKLCSAVRRIFVRTLLRTPNRARTVLRGAVLSAHPQEQRRGEGRPFLPCARSRQPTYPRPLRHGRADRLRRNERESRPRMRAAWTRRCHGARRRPRRAPSAARDPGHARQVRHSPRGRAAAPRRRRQALPRLPPPRGTARPAASRFLAP